MPKKGKRPVPVDLPKAEKPIIIDPNRIKVRDMRGILLSGCGPHEDKKKKANKYKCRDRNDDSGLNSFQIDADNSDLNDLRLL